MLNLVSRSTLAKLLACILSGSAACVNIPTLLDAHIDGKNSCLVLYFGDPSTAIVPKIESVEAKHEISLLFALAGDLENKTNAALSKLHRGTLMGLSGNFSIETSLSRSSTQEGQATLLLRFDPENLKVLVDSFVGKHPSRSDLKLTRVVRIEVVSSGRIQNWAKRISAEDQTIVQACGPGVAVSA